jgi:hypothetical protein
MLTRFSLCAALLALAACGCGSSPTDNKTGLDLGGADATAVATLVEDMNDAKGNPKKIAGLFVKEAAPDAKKFNAYDYYIVGKPTMTGTDARCKVRIDTNGATKGEQEWSFVKEGDKWKIKAAPLP